MDKVEYPSGHYPIQNRSGEVERLRIQDAALSGATNNLFDAMGVSSGWRCLDLGCGPGGITKYLLDRVGPDGHVTGLDGDEEFLAVARIDKAANSEFILGDAYATGLPDNKFDLVHVRFLASTAGEPEGLVSEAVRLVAPGGVVAMQEADFHTLRCFPEHPAWTELTKIFIACFPDGRDDPISHRLYRLMRRAGLEEVCYNPVLVGTRAQDAWQDYLPSTINSMEQRIIGDLGVPKNHLERLIADVREHLANPDTVWTSYTVVQTWGRVPGA
ncbi:methyltransferase domain-containing protein [Fluviibacterium sp. DFM31]|uniref:Methyltransferase domain-containing protein n=1 Tax=Meridianimarinicoccus marinus TaxID=3231483 RepID=A0ABV3L2T0_9RHOB